MMSLFCSFLIGPTLQCPRFRHPREATLVLTRGWWSQERLGSVDKRWRNVPYTDERQMKYMSTIIMDAKLYALLFQGHFTFGKFSIVLFHVAISPFLDEHMMSHTEKLELVKSRQERGSDTNQPTLLSKVRDLLDVFRLVKVNSISLSKKKKSESSLSTFGTIFFQLPAPTLQQSNKDPCPIV